MDESTHHLLPHIPQAHKASRHVALAVAKTAIEEGLATVPIDQSVEDLISQQILALIISPTGENKKFKILRFPKFIYSLIPRK